MRWLILLATLPLAGCLAEDATVAPPPDEPAAVAEPAPPREKLDVRIAHDQTRGGEHRETFDVPADAGPVDLVLAHYPLGGAPAGECVNVDARIDVLDPAGEAAFAFGGVAWAGPTMGACSEQPNPAVRLAPGTWTVVFTGRAAMTGVVRVTEG